MSEGLDQWPFVFAAYAVGIGGTFVTAGWAWVAMRRAERRRDRARGK
ncbi:hypothetical protein [Croceicoccus hydrothermalis]|nr:hypothetical protein [Croceicoccus hydrothermalis]